MVEKYSLGDKNARKIKWIRLKADTKLFRKYKEKFDKMEKKINFRYALFVEKS